VSRRIAYITTADDFGLSLPLNEAVERAHREGILGGASLMVAEPAAADAVRRARTLPDLRVGLHVALVAGRPLLPPSEIPAIVTRDGVFSNALAMSGMNFFFRPGVRQQLEREIRAQFAAFAATGLRLDHVNAQCHMHLHPTVFGILLRVMREYGSPPMRVPREPFGPSWRANRDARGARLANAMLLRPWLALMRARLRVAGIASNDRCFGLSDVGRMTADRVVAMAAELRPGTTEFFFHVATGSWPNMAPALRSYRFDDELATLVDPRVARAFARAGGERIAFGDLAADAR